ncbi:hypothetical protein F2Q70_00033550 [Brassica cretica]|uniref:Uncharacterized protein n=1 Tax=Brassica cretica TaxID=69181 RepID=A0A8S9FK07_BRACR|nr:hypothetical protein F2Q70_00033550 [Brassica cretica]
MTFRSPSRSSPSSPPMDSSATVSFGSPFLPPEPPDPGLVVVFLINPPDPPPVLLPLCSDVDVLSTQPALLHLLLAGISSSGALNSGLSYSSFRHYPVSKPIIITSCVEHVLLKSALRASTIYHQESCVVSLSVARLLISIAECKLTSLQYSSLQSLKDWAWNVEILVVIFSLFAALNTSMQHFEVELSTALCKVLLSWSSFVPHFEDVTLPLSFRLKLFLPQYKEVTRCDTTLLPQCEDFIWTAVSVAMVSLISGVSRLWWFSSQLSVSSKRCLVAFEIVVGSFSIGSWVFLNWLLSDLFGEWNVDGSLCHPSLIE